MQNLAVMEPGIMEDSGHYMLDEPERIVQFTAPTDETEVQSQVLEKILNDRCIKPVYQPIVSLTDGQIFGFEALSRIAGDGNLDISIEQVFKIANLRKKTWELESLCREKALQGIAAAAFKHDKKLFLNVCPNVINDEKFKNGFTMEYLDKNGLSPDGIVFEITERIAVTDNEAFLNSIGHYRNQNYRIAIDDVGAGFSGLNMIADLRPDFIKIDMHLIRNIDNDEIKQLLCKSLADFGKSAGIALIAEGIETEEELKVCIKLKIDYGQGYLLCVPREDFISEIAPEKMETIRKFNQKHYNDNIKNSLYPAIGHLSKPGYTFLPDENMETVYKTLLANPTITSFAIVQDDNTVLGFMTRNALNELMGGRYGFWLHNKWTIRQAMDNNFLRVNSNMPIDQASRLAMQRPFERLYDPIVVEKENKYSGVVTIKDLLNAHTKIEVETAVHTNPLTKLPGNITIEKEIKKRLLGSEPYCIVYIDVDNFKAYNDAYGFENGDLMLKLVADVIKECAARDEFIGHIGGDDFIIVCDYHETENYCRTILERFASRVTALYRDDDLENGCITSINRSGVVEKFPIASLSIAGITNRVNTYKTIDEFSNSVATLKKKCKKQIGNYFEVQ